MKKFALLALVLLTACGFEPIYGPHSGNGETADILNQVAIDNIPDRQGQMLRNDLIDRMYGKGRPRKPLYRLKITLQTTVQDLAIQANATSTRSLRDTTANYSLIDSNGKEVLSGSAHSLTSFNKLSDQYGSLAASEGGLERTIKEVSEQIVNRISLYLAEPLQPVPMDKKDRVTQPPPPPTNSQPAPTASDLP